MNPQDQQAIDRISSHVMGVDPAQQQAPQMQREPQQTQQEAATKTASPRAEGDKAKESPATPAAPAARQAAEEPLFEIDFGEGSKRALSPEQIRQTYKRYADLNHKHASMGPALGIVDEVMKRTGANGEQVSQLLATALKGLVKNPQMGKTAHPNRPAQPGDGSPSMAKPAQASKMSAMGQDLEEAFSKYEDENAISLPPGYRENLTSIQQVQQQMGQLTQMMNAVLQQSRAGAQAGMQQAQAAQQDRGHLIRERIASNVDAIQQKHGLSDEEAPDFMNFAAERGFTQEDFIDPRLLTTIAQDYVNAKNSGELENLRTSFQRRQAFLGSQGSTPSSGGPAPQGSPDQQFFNNLLGAAMKKRGMG